MPDSFAILNRDVVECRRCPRLVAWREEVARVKRRAYLQCAYWGKPVPSFGDDNARLLLVGLAPGAHGANRTGRMFTGDRSGEFLYRALYEAGFANQPTSVSADDGLRLMDAKITAPVRCVPPDNRPDRSEILNCRPFFHRALKLAAHVQVVVALGGIAWAEYLSYLRDTGCIRSRSLFTFGHGALYETHPGGPKLLGCYHPSQQNTSTGKLTAAMLEALFSKARTLLT